MHWALNSGHSAKHSTWYPRVLKLWIGFAKRWTFSYGYPPNPTCCALGFKPSEDKAKPTVTNDPWRKSTTWEPLQHTRTEHSGRVQQQVKFKTTSTKFQEHATNKHVMILSCKGVSYGIAISQTLFTAPSLDHRCTLVQVTYNTFKSSITSCKNIPKRSSEKLSTSWTAQP